VKDEALVLDGEHGRRAYAKHVCLPLLALGSGWAHQPPLSWLAVLYEHVLLDVGGLGCHAALLCSGPRLWGPGSRGMVSASCCRAVAKQRRYVAGLLSGRMASARLKSIGRARWRVMGGSRIGGSSATHGAVASGWIPLELGYHR
jgi:hypothetical protein